MRNVLGGVVVLVADVQKDEVRILEMRGEPRRGDDQLVARRCRTAACAGERDETGEKNRNRDAHGRSHWRRSPWGTGRSTSADLPPAGAGGWSNGAYRRCNGATPFAIAVDAKS